MYKFLNRIKFFSNFRMDMEETSTFIMNCIQTIKHEHFIIGDILYHYGKKLTIKKKSMQSIFNRRNPFIGDKTERIYFMISGQVAQYVPKTKDEMKRERENFNINLLVKKKNPHILLINNNRRVFYSQQGLVTFKKLQNISE